MKKITWRELNNQITMMNEQEIADMLQAELVSERRSSFIRRLHMRYNTLRVSRERIELLKQAVKP